MNDITVTPTDNGPYLIQGGVTLLDADGNHYAVSDTIALCRCGHSSTKPFCDGTHESAKFAAVNRAVSRNTEGGDDSSARLRLRQQAGREQARAGRA